MRQLQLDYNRTRLHLQFRQNIVGQRQSHHRRLHASLPRVNSRQTTGMRFILNCPPPIGLLTFQNLPPTTIRAITPAISPVKQSPVNPLAVHTSQTKPFRHAPPTVSDAPSGRLPYPFEQLVSTVKQGTSNAISASCKTLKTILSQATAGHQQQSHQPRCVQ